MKILTVANIVRRKRIDLCVLACRQLREKAGVSNLEWTVIGRGSFEEKIKGLAPDSMKFIPKVDSLKEHYRKSDVFVLPSADEGFGMVYIEAIMCGCPVICRKNDGGEEIVLGTGGGTAVDIPDSDHEAVANIIEAIQTIAGNKDRYMNASVKEAARLMVDPERIRREWLKILMD